jgi:hypothetical protein
MDMPLIQSETVLDLWCVVLNSHLVEVGDDDGDLIGGDGRAAGAGIDERVHVCQQLLTTVQRRVLAEEHLQWPIDKPRGRKIIIVVIIIIVIYYYYYFIIILY